MLLLYDVLRLLPWLWEAVLLPYVVNALASLVSDGLESVYQLRTIAHVVGCMLLRRSHRPYPPRRSKLADLKRRSHQLRRDEAHRAMTGTHYTGEGSDCSNFSSDSDQEGFPPLTRFSLSGTSVAWAGFPPGTCRFIQRRVLTGRKGESANWMRAAPARHLVPFSASLSYSKSLHCLVSAVVGPLIQPTASLVPKRQADPQWPPHYGPKSRSVRVQAMDRALRQSESSQAVEMDSGRDSATESLGTSSSHVLRRGRRAAHTPYSKASSVVYHRVRACQLEMRPGSLHPSQQIASITGHHVLSYLATRQKVLVIDLDETLCHVSTTTANMVGPPTFSEVVPTASGAELFHVWVRPHAQLFLRTAAKLCSMVLFTSATKPYADTILARIDPEEHLKERFYRQDCRVMSRGAILKVLKANAGGRGDEARRSVDGSRSRASPAATTAGSDGSESGWSEVSAELSDGQRGGAEEVAGKPIFNEGTRVLVKDLRTIKVPSEMIIMVDNSEECALLNRDNALIIPPYIPSLEHQHRLAVERGEADAMEVEDDQVLLSLIPLLESLLVVPDVRSILRLGRSW